MGCQLASPLRSAITLLPLVLLAGCVPDSSIQTAIATYTQAADTLGHAAGDLFLHANTVEADAYIDTRIFTRQPLAQPDIDQQAVLSVQGLAVRRQAIQALSTYTLALAALASGKPEAAIANDAAAAGGNLAGLTGDIQTALAKDDPAAATLNLAGPIAAAAAAAGELAQLLERRHSRSELQSSLRKNDPALQQLFTLLTQDAERLYLRQRLNTEKRGVETYARYAAALQQPTPDPAYLLDLGDRIRRFRRDTALLSAADPAPTFTAWQAAHSELVATLLDGNPSETRDRSLRHLLATIKTFADDVQPFATNMQTLVQDL